MNRFGIYNRSELFNKIDKLSITRENDQIITKYDNRVIKVSNVSDKYEIFDIVKYIKDRIFDIEKNFDIIKYQLIIKGGQQQLKLVSDKIEIGGVEFYKSFYILNSTDKSRRLSFNVGLYSEKSNFYTINSASNIGLVKKHLRGVTEAADEASVGLNGETFNDQITSLKSLVGHRIKLSKIRDVIVGDGSNVNHLKFDAFKNSIRFATYDNQLVISKDQKNMLYKPSKELVISNEMDFYLDAFWVLQVYLRLFSKKDSHIIKNETSRIMEITQWSIRNKVLESLGI